MKNILVTGGCGFIGSNFIHYLLCQQEFTGSIINVDKLTYAGCIDNTVFFDKKYSNRYFFERADICDQESMDTIFNKYEIDTVVHFAAESHVDRSILFPDDFIKTNVFGTFVLLELAKARKDKFNLFHHVSTDEVYGSLGLTGYFTEQTSYKPNSPYSASKAASDHFVRAYCKTYGLPVTISNCSNNYGPYQFPEKLIPLMIQNIFEDKPLPVYGDGKNIRDWLYVLDHCKAVWEIMKNGTKGQVYNIGGRCEMQNIDLINTICDVLDEIFFSRSIGTSRNLITFVKDRPGHDRRYAIDCSKIEKELGWKPEENFESGIRKTIKWYIENQEWVNRIKSGEYMNWLQTNYQQR